MSLGFSMNKFHLLNNRQNAQDDYFVTCRKSSDTIEVRRKNLWGRNLTIPTTLWPFIASRLSKVSTHMICIKIDTQKTSLSSLHCDQKLYQLIEFHYWGRTEAGKMIPRASFVGGQNQCTFVQLLRFIFLGMPQLVPIRWHFMSRVHNLKPVVN